MAGRGNKVALPTIDQLQNEETPDYIKNLPSVSIILHSSLYQSNALDTTIDGIISCLINHANKKKQLVFGSSTGVTSITSLISSTVAVITDMVFLLTNKKEKDILEKVLPLFPAHFYEPIQAAAAILIGEYGVDKKYKLKPYEIEQMATDVVRAVLYLRKELKIV